MYIITLFICRVSADGETTNAQVNLAIKGIIAIKAMSKLSQALGRSDDATRYSVSLQFSKLVTETILSWC